MRRMIQLEENTADPQRLAMFREAWRQKVWQGSIRGIGGTMPFIWAEASALCASSCPSAVRHRAAIDSGGLGQRSGAGRGRHAPGSKDLAVPPSAQVLALRLNTLAPCPRALQAMRAVTEVMADPSKLENWRSNRPLYKFVKRALQGRI